MANIRTGSIVSDIRGKVGSEIYSRNRGGAYVKAYAAPVQPNSARQLTARSRLADANNQWLALSDTERHEWQILADTVHKKGNAFSPVKLTGRQLFIQRKMNLRYINISLNPIPCRAARMVNMSATASLNLAQTFFSIVRTVDAPTPGGEVAVFASPIMSAGVMSPNTPTYTWIHRFTDLTAGSLMARSVYENVWGSIVGPAGRKIFFKLRAIANNILGPSPLPNVRSGQQMCNDVYVVCVLPEVN